MTEFPMLRQALPPLLGWTRKEALPFWGTVGVDHARGGFHERLDMQGRPILEVPKRLMVQGRQLYVYCHAGLLGWYPDARRLADRCVEYMLSSFHERDGKPGWIHSVAADGSIADATRDCYAHAFALFGLAWYHRFTGDTQVLRIADRTIAFLDDSIASPRGGYLDAAPASDGIRRQNPHMHLFEAFIALFQATGAAHYLSHAAEIFGVFTTRFFRADTGALCEYFAQDLGPLSDATGRISEPGHHYEWTWLLWKFQQASTRATATFSSALYAHADSHGWDKQGFIIDEVDVSGAPITRSRRSWPHAEGLKANIVEGEAGRAGCDDRAARCAARLTDTFLGRPMPAIWTDRVDENGRRMSDFVPASTLYHVFGAVAEALRVTSGIGQEFMRPPCRFGPSL
jgi:mannose/cellobiose epimerase-like protein (N-acyl-D-glucosamine 2-epimerase family)